MPHKHVRKETKGTDFNLAPTQIAKPLSAFDKSNVKAKGTKGGNKKQHDDAPRKRRKPSASTNATTTTNGYKDDDTPRAFARLMQQQTNKRSISGLDDGSDRRAKKAKTSTADADLKAVSKKAEQLGVPKILPGERMADFAARVDQALPVSGLARKGKMNIEGMKERTTKTEKRLKKMYAEWRVEEERRKERLEELAEQKEEEEAEQEAELGGQSIKVPEEGKRKRRKEIGEIGDNDEDPWAVLQSKRDKPKGLHDVVQAPPEFKAIPKEKFKVRNGAGANVANVPNASGSLAKREELGDARREVIERYRAMMKAGRS